MRRTPFALIVFVLTLATAAAGVPVPDLYAYVVADATETEPEEPYAAEVAVPEPAAVEIGGEGGFICYDCRVRFETETEYVEHVKAEHPDKWDAMKSDYEGWFEEQGPETESGFQLNPYLKIALIGGAFVTAFIIVRWQGTIGSTD